MGLLEHVIVTPLRQIAHPKGDILHAMKQSDAGFCGFGEAYFSTITQNEIKGWKRHRRMTLNLVVPVGSVRFVLFDDDSGCFRSETLSLDNYCRLTVPPGIWMAFEGVGEGTNLLLNLADMEHDPEEADTRGLEEITYGW